MILPLRSQNRHSPLFCIHPIAGINWSCCGLLKHRGPDYPIYAVQARSLAQPKPCPASVEKMAKEPVPGKHNILGGLVGMLGSDPPDPQDKPVISTQVVELLCSQDNALASLQEQHISAIVEILINNARRHQQRRTISCGEI